MSNEENNSENVTDADLSELLDSVLDDFNRLSKPSENKDLPPTDSQVSTSKKSNSPKKGSSSKNKKAGKASISTNTDETKLFEKFLGDLQSSFPEDGTPEEEELNGTDINQLINAMQSSMEEMMAEFNSSPLDPDIDGDNPFNLHEFQSLLAEVSKTESTVNPTKLIPPKPSGSSSQPTTKSTNVAQSKIIDCLKSLTDALPADRSTDPTEKNDALFTGFFSDMLKKLLDKDLIYPSLKPICDRYPNWLDENARKLSSEELAQRKKQAEELSIVCKLYEAQTEAWNENKITEQQLVTLMEHIEVAMRDGAPPEDLVQATDESDPTIDNDEQQQRLQQLLQMTSGVSGDPALNPEQCSVM